MVNLLRLKYLFKELIIDEAVQALEFEAMLMHTINVRVESES